MSKSILRSVGVGLIGVCCLLCCRPAGAVSIYAIQNGLQLLFMAQCGNGQTFGPFGDVGSAMQVGGILCENFGGLADVTEVEVLAARQRPFGPPSSITLGRDLGGGNFQVLLPEDFAEIIDGTGGEPQELIDVRVLSVIVRGQELVAGPTRGPGPEQLPLEEIYADDDEDGNFVGGPTGEPMPVPLSNVVSIALVLILLGSGVLLLSRTRFSG